MSQPENKKTPPVPKVGSIKLTHCTVDLSHRRVDWGNGTVFGLTGREVELLEYLNAHPRRVLGRDELYRSVWGYHAVSLSRAVDTAIKRLREKIEIDPSEPQHIFTTYAMGYRFEPYAEEKSRLEGAEAESPLPLEAATAAPGREELADKQGIVKGEPGGRSPMQDPATQISYREASEAAGMTAQPERLPTGPIAAPLLSHSASQSPSSANAPAVPMARETETSEILRLFRGGERMVTLLGPPGIGKSTLARHCGHRICQEALGFRTVWFCDLAEARSLEDIYRLLLQAIDEDRQRPDTLTTLSQQLEQRLLGQEAALIILDNVEQLIPQVPKTLGAWLNRCPQLRWLVTSREQLPIEQGISFVVGALPEADAVQFFIKRARLQRWDYQPSKAAHSEIVQIVRHLDGIPLALELAAARISVLSASQILERLRARFDLLHRSKSGGNRRHDSMRHAIDGSWELLTEAEREAFAQLAVFRGGFTLAAAEAVVNVPRTGHTLLVLDLVELLVGRSLVHLESQETPEPGQRVPGSQAGLPDSPSTRDPFSAPAAPAIPRFQLYECIREYALEKLAGLDSQQEVRQRHANYFLSWAESLLQQLRANQNLPTAHLIAQEMPNLDEMLDHFKTNDANALARAVIALQSLGVGRESRSMRFARLNAAVAYAEAMEVRLRIRLFFEWVSAYLVSSGWDPDAVSKCRGVLRQALEQAEALGSPELVAQTHFMLGRTYIVGDSISEGLPHLEAARQLCREHRLARLELMVSLSMAPVHFKTGHCDADTLFLDLRAKAARQQEPLLETVVQAFVTETLEEQGHFAGSERSGRAMLEAAERHCLWEPMVLARIFLGRAHVDLRQFEAAGRVYQEAAERVWRTDNPLVVASVYCEWSLLQLLLGHVQDARTTHSKGFQHIAFWARPDIAQYFAILGFIQASMGEMEEARMSFLETGRRLKGLENLSTQLLLSLCEVFLELRLPGSRAAGSIPAQSAPLPARAYAVVQSVEDFPLQDPLLSPRAPLNVLRFVLRQLARLVRQELEKDSCAL